MPGKKTAAKRRKIRSEISNEKGGGGVKYVPMKGVVGCTGKRLRRTKKGGGGKRKRGRRFQPYKKHGKNSHLFPDVYNLGNGQTPYFLVPKSHVILVNGGGGDPPPAGGVPPPPHPSNN